MTEEFWLLAKIMVAGLTIAMAWLGATIALENYPRNIGHWLGAALCVAGGIVMLRMLWIL